MGTEKRERQKANRAAKREAEAVQEKQESRRRTVVGFAVAVAAVAVIVGLIYLGSDDSDSTASDTTSSTAPQTAPSTAAPDLSPTEFTYGTTACPPAEGTDEPVLDFDAAPENCLEPGKTYTATFETTAGTVVVELDTENTPGTANNFVFLARNRYYDGTELFRVNDQIDIIQGGSPHTQSTSDPGPGYQLLDEGEFSADATRGGYTYQPGDLVMARTPGPNGAGAQFFFVTGPGGANLDAQGSYVVFGEVTEGLEILEQIVATTTVDDTGEGEPDPEVVVESVTITES